jgi:hypothetical protein
MRTALLTFLACLFVASVEAQPLTGHPRLYFTAADLPRLRELRTKDLHKLVWENMRASADWALTRKPREKWIAPIAPDPIYENLYDRFYAIMGDLAITEHLAFAYAFSGDERYGDAARQWTLASCRAWKNEAEGKPDGGKAYAVMRLLKGIAVAYDVVYDRFTDAERKEIRETLISIGEKYFEGYFSTPTIAGESFHTHHAHVEWSSFGVMALALLGETPQAQQWLDATVKKFEEHLLPLGLAPDGAQVEGATFWASSMQYRFFFMDALRRVTGRDLFKPYEKYMNADIGLASIAAEHEPGYTQNNQSVVMAPSYSQLDYYSPVLLMLAREYHRPLCQKLALWDHSMGSIQRTRFVTPHGEQLLFELGGYAYLWLDEVRHDDATDPRLSFHFPSVDEAYLRASWNPGDLLIGVRKGELLIHDRTYGLLSDAVDWREPPAPLTVKDLHDDGSVAVLTCADDKGQSLTVELHRPDRAIIRRRVKGDWEWSCQGEPTREGNTVTWKGGATLRVTHGTITKWEPEGYAPKLAVGFGKLEMADPLPSKFPRATITAPEDGEIVLEVQHR